jgi:DNA-binding transcriptional LysR family regulator
MSKNRTIDQIDLRRLAVFRAVVDAGGVTAAAASLHRSASAVSDDLAVLQRHLGTPLFEKVGRHLRPTAKGRALARSLERAYLDLQDAWNAAVGDDAGEPLRIAAVTGFGRYRLLPALLAALPAERRLEVRFSTADEMAALIARGRVDLGVAYRPLVGEGIASTVLATEEIVLVGPADSAAPDDPASLRFVTYDEYEYVFLHWFNHHGIALPQPWRRSDHCEELEEALESVANGRGWSVVPADAARSRAFEGRVTPHPFGGACTNTIYLAARERALDAADARWMASLSGICG